jgi:hypothetical protein
MSINIETKPEMNVVNVGEEITQDKINALNASAINGSPTATNPFLTRTNTFNTTDTAVRITQTGAGEAFRVEDDANPDSSAFVIDASGDVGIGSNPVTGSKLNVQGNLRVVGTSTLSGATSITVSSGSTVPLTVQNNGTGNSFVVNDIASDTTPFVIDADGRVGIGTTTLGTNALTVAGTTSLGGSISATQAGTPTVATFTLSNTGSTNPAVVIENRGTGNSFVVNDEPSDTSPFIIDASGAVGIGRQPTAGFRLDLAGNILVAGSVHTFSLASQGAVITQVSGTANTLTVNNSGTGNSFVVNDDGTGDTSPFVIDNAGSVGIKKSSPAYDLDVNGTANVGTLRFSDGTTMTTAPSASGPLVLTNGLYATTYGEGVIEMENDGDIYFSVSGPYITLKNGTSEMEIGGIKIVFPDSTEQTTAYVPPTYETTGLATNVNRTDFPNEIAIVIAGVTYRIPARQV